LLFVSMAKAYILLICCIYQIEDRPDLAHTYHVILFYSLQLIITYFCSVDPLLRYTLDHARSLSGRTITSLSPIDGQSVQILFKSKSGSFVYHSKRRLLLLPSTLLTLLTLLNSCVLLQSDGRTSRYNYYSAGRFILVDGPLSTQETHL
jgi:hypothetical protein